MARGTVLVVEDDPSMADTIRRNLAARGYTVVGAATVAEAAAALQRERPSLVLLDIDLPDGSGWEVPRALGLVDSARVAVIVMSGLRPNARLVAETGCAGILEKPFPIESLLRMVRQCLDQPARESAIE